MEPFGNVVTSSSPVLVYIFRCSPFCRETYPTRAILGIFARFISISWGGPVGNALRERGNRNSCVQSRLVLSQRTLHNYLSFAFNEWERTTVITAMIMKWQSAWSEWLWRRFYFELDIHLFINYFHSSAYDWLSGSFFLRRKFPRKSISKILPRGSKPNTIRNSETQIGLGSHQIWIDASR